MIRPVKSGEVGAHGAAELLTARGADELARLHRLLLVEVVEVVERHLLRGVGLLWREPTPTWSGETRAGAKSSVAIVRRKICM